MVSLFKILILIRKRIFDYIYDDEDINKNSGDEKFSFDTNI